MKAIIVLLLVGLGVVTTLTGYFSKNETAVQMQFEPVAVVELFTSQGCSSCPPADRLLENLISSEQAGKRSIYALSYHVDYWDRLGWKDPFSQHAFSVRQQNYTAAFKLNSAYTPQMIVNGTTQFVGSNNDALERALKTELDKPAGVRFKALQVQYLSSHEIQLSYSLEGDFTKNDLKIALVSKTATTRVTRGENSGCRLVNKNIVRSFVSIPANASSKVRLNIINLDKQNTELILFIQDHYGSVKGAISTSLPL